MPEKLSSGFHSTVSVSGQAVQIITSGSNIGGGIIVNPFSADDQGISVSEQLYVSITLPPNGAFVDPSTGTVAIASGASFSVPSGVNVWVTAFTAGHSFSSLFYGIPIQFPPTPVPGNFPPCGPTGLLNLIYAYLYQEYTDDEDLQAFFASLNSMQQDYMDTFNALNLPIYTNPLIAGKLADWVMEGIYGYSRPTLYVQSNIPVGPLNSYVPGEDAGYWPGYPIAINELKFLGPQNIVLASDDVYKRCLTWHYLKGDGRYFNIRWLKRRVMRFLFGSNGTAGIPIAKDDCGRDITNIDQTNQISITFNPTYGVTIRFVLNIQTIIGGAICNMFGCNGVNAIIGQPVAKTGVVTINSMDIIVTTLPPLPFMNEFKEAVDTGVLELPFQFNYTVVIG